MDGGLGHETLWFPLRWLGITENYSAIEAGTVINTWITLAVLLVVILIARYALLYKPSEEIDHAHPPVIDFRAYLKFAAIGAIRALISLVDQAGGTFVYRYFSFISSIFIFILFCNWIALIPYVEEPTQDLNTTLALGIITLLYIQKEIIKVHGIKHYLKEYFLPVPLFFPLNLIVGLTLLPFKILGELASVISLSFRLFGNIFGGSIIAQLFKRGLSGSIVWQTFGTISGLQLLLTFFFIIFEGGLQAFVFSILALTNISMATAIEEGHHS